MEVQVVGELGRRVHLRTGHNVIYLAVRPVTAQHPRADGRELIRLVWARLPEIEQLMPDLFGPVRTHLDDGAGPWFRRSPTEFGTVVVGAK
jgi:hypothetical protein